MVWTWSRRHSLGALKINVKLHLVGGLAGPVLGGLGGLCVLSGRGWQEDKTVRLAKQTDEMDGEMWEAEALEITAGHKKDAWQ